MQFYPKNKAIPVVWTPPLDGKIQPIFKIAMSPGLIGVVEVAEIPERTPSMMRVHFFPYSCPFTSVAVFAMRIVTVQLVSNAKSGDRDAAEWIEWQDAKRPSRSGSQLPITDDIWDGVGPRGIYAEEEKKFKNSVSFFNLPPHLLPHLSPSCWREILCFVRHRLRNRRRRGWRTGRERWWRWHSCVEPFWVVRGCEGLDWFVERGVDMAFGVLRCEDR